MADGDAGGGAAAPKRGRRERGACCRRALGPHEMETRAWAEFSLLCLLGLSGYVHSGFLAFETPDKI